MTQFLWKSIEDTERHAQSLASKLRGGEVITLEGDLGAGKTTWTQFFAKALGIEGTVNSPTFTIMKSYEGRFTFHHLDVYRLEGSDEDLGWDEIFDGQAVSVVEWAHFIEDELPTERLNMVLRLDDNGDRVCTMSATGDHFEQVVKELANDLVRD